MGTKNEIKNGKKIIKKERDKNFYMTIFILIIMVMSIAGFAMMSSSNGGQRTNSNGLPQNLDLTMQQQDGQNYWIAVRDYKPFIFTNIDGYDQDLVSIGIANKLKSKSVVNIYVDENYESQDAVFLLERALLGLKIMTTQLIEYNCDENSVVFTYNQSITGNCIIINVQKDDAYKKAESIVYNLVK